MDVDLTTLAQIVTLLVSLVELLFFGYHLQRQKDSIHREPIWEPFWVTSVECLNYIIQISSNSYRFEMADGALINVTSSIGTYNFTVIH